MNAVLKCAIIAVLDEVVYGTTVGTFTWIGIANVDEPLKKIITELDTVA